MISLDKQTVSNSEFCQTLGTESSPAPIVKNPATIDPVTSIPCPLIQPRKPLVIEPVTQTGNKKKDILIRPNDSLARDLTVLEFISNKLKSFVRVHLTSYFFLHLACIISANFSCSREYHTCTVQKERPPKEPPPNILFFLLNFSCHDQIVFHFYSVRCNWKHPDLSTQITSTDKKKCVIFKEAVRLPIQYLFFFSFEFLFMKFRG